MKTGRQIRHSFWRPSRDEKERHSPRSVLKAGSSYFGIVFAAGFALGAFRVKTLEPALGQVFATAIELPAMLLLSWFACRHLVERFGIAPRWGDRLGMGGLAFILLIAAEMALGVFGFSRTLLDQLAAYRQPGPALGLAAQLAFASFPALQPRIKRP